MSSSEGKADTAGPAPVAADPWDGDTLLQTVWTAKKKKYPKLLPLTESTVEEGMTLQDWFVEEPPERREMVGTAFCPILSKLCRDLGLTKTETEDKEVKSGGGGVSKEQVRQIVRQENKKLRSASSNTEALSTAELYERLVQSESVSTNALIDYPTLDPSTDDKWPTELHKISAPNFGESEVTWERREFEAIRKTFHAVPAFAAHWTLQDTHSDAVLKSSPASAYGRRPDLSVTVKGCVPGDGSVVAPGDLKVNGLTDSNRGQLVNYLGRVQRIRKAASVRGFLLSVKPGVGDNASLQLLELSGPLNEPVVQQSPVMTFNIGHDSGVGKVARRASRVEAFGRLFHFLCEITPPETIGKFLVGPLLTLPVDVKDDTEIHKAWPVGAPGPSVVLKRLDSSKPDATARYQRERDAYTQLAASEPPIPNTLRLKHSDDATCSLILSPRIKADPFSDALTPSQFMSVCGTVDAFHQANVVWGDVRLANVLIAELVRGKAPYVIDLGYGGVANDELVVEGYQCVQNKLMGWRRRREPDTPMTFADAKLRDKDGLIALWLRSLTVSQDKCELLLHAVGEGTDVATFDGLGGDYKILSKEVTEWKNLAENKETSCVALGARMTGFVGAVADIITDATVVQQRKEVSRGVVAPASEPSRGVGAPASAGVGAGAGAGTDMSRK